MFRFLFITVLLLSDASATLGQLPPVDGFDYPVGKPNAVGYEVCQDFREVVDNFCNHISWDGTHLGEDWNRGSGNTDCSDVVYSIADGEVLIAGYIDGCWGYVVIIRHEMPGGSPLESMYGHLQNIGVIQGQLVTRGQMIGEIGGDNLVCQGQTMTCHLHFEIRFPDCPDWGEPGFGYLPDPTGWTDPSNFIEANRPPQKFHTSISDFNDGNLSGGAIVQYQGEGLPNNGTVTLKYTTNGLGTWTERDNLPFWIYSVSSVQKGNTVYIPVYAPGIVPAPGIKPTLRTELTTEQISDWSYLSDIGNPRIDGSAAYYEGRLYVLYVCAIWSAKIFSNGDIGEWELIRTLPFCFQESGFVATQGFLYILGGRILSTTQKTVYALRILPNGELSEPIQQADLPVPLQNFACLESNGYVMTFGGFSIPSNCRTVPSTTVDEVYSGRIETDGSILSWSLAGTLPAPRLSGVVTTVGGHIVFSGGGVNSYCGKYTSPDVWLFEETTDGTLGDPLGNFPLPFTRWGMGWQLTSNTSISLAAQLPQSPGLNQMSGELL